MTEKDLRQVKFLDVSCMPLTDKDMRTLLPLENLSKLAFVGFGCCDLTLRESADAARLRRFRNREVARLMLHNGNGWVEVDLSPLEDA